MNMSINPNINNFAHNTNKEKNTKNESIKVCIRVRPLLQHEDMEFWGVDEGKNTIATINTNNMRGFNSENSRGDGSSVLSQKEKDIKKVLMDSIYSPQNFAFDKIYSTSANSQSIYKEMCRNLTKRIISGYNGTIFMYGQTTSGKTFTMLGTPNSPGILPCALRDIFNLISKESSPESFNVSCSYIEIYNENLHDLLTDSNNLKLVDDNKYGVIVSGAKRVKIKSFEDGITLKDFGEENRKYRETLINEYSSRSHSIFQIFIESEYLTETEGIKYSCLNLVDLAGSERLTDYDSKSEVFGETGYINKSLFVLANVVNKLAEGKNTYIPYRDSKLTRLISQALGGNSLTAIICTISPAAVNYYQTLSTLRFANRAKIVKTKPTINEYVDDKSAIQFYKSEIKKLQEALTKNKIPLNSLNNAVGNVTPFPKDFIEHIMKTNESLSNELESYKEKYLNEKEKNEVYKNEIEKLKSVMTNSSHIRNHSIDKLNLNYDYIANYSNEELQKIGVNSNTLSYKSDTKNNINEVYFVENLVNKISPQIEKLKNFVNYKEEAENLNSEYKIDLLNMQNKYKDKLRDNCHKIFPGYSNSLTNVFKILNDKASGTLSGINSSEHVNSNIMKELNINSSFASSSEINYNPNVNSYDNYSNNNNFNDDKDDIIKKIKTALIFQDIRINFSQNVYQDFESNLKNLKQVYEDKVDSLEKNMDYFKYYLENYYRKKIQRTRNNHLDNLEFMNENLPIMNITSEHNEKLKMLRELYDLKLKDLEQTFFDNLKIITASRMSKEY